MEKKQVLIVDDEVQIARALCRTLEWGLKSGCQLEICTESYDALSRIQCQHYDLLISDIQLPALNGLELLKAARVCIPDLRAIMITAFGSPTIEQKVQQLQAQYIPKPFNLRDFLVIAQQLLENNCQQIIILINMDVDIINARQKVREVARLMGMNVTDQARISMATSSIAYALKMGSHCNDQIHIEWIVNTLGRGIRIVCMVDEYVELPVSILKDISWMTDQLTVESSYLKNSRIVLIKYV